MISVNSLYKYYAHIRAVENVSFEIKKGEVVGFLGPNGAGKTTTMQIITGYINPTSGDVFVDDLNVLAHPVEIKKKIGYLPENTPLYEDLTVYDFLDFTASIRELGRKKTTAIKEACERCGITEVIDRTIGTLSKGYKQRVGLAQAILHDPPILILDEPTTGLDPLQIGEIRSLIKELGREKTVIVSTHILPEVEQTCNRIILINKGSIAEDSPIDDLKRRLSGGIRVDYKGTTPPQAFERFGRVEIIGRENGINRIRIIPDNSRDIREELFLFSKQQDLILLELYTEQRSLESIFRQLTEQ